MKQSRSCVRTDLHSQSRPFDVLELLRHSQARVAIVSEATVWGWRQAKSTRELAKADFADFVHADGERMATATTMQIGCSARVRADAAMFAADPGEELADDPIGGDIVVAFDDRDRSGCDRQRDQMTARRVRELRA